MNDIKRETGLEQTLDELRRDVDPFSPSTSHPDSVDDQDDESGSVEETEEAEEAAVEFIRDDEPPLKSE
jgi:hypothetical protein